MNAQRTLRRSISCAGIGLHSGRKVTLSLKPAAAGSGIRFRRADLGGLEVPATVKHVGGINYATGLTRDAVSVDTVEHLLAALVSLGIDNVIVELNSPEVPIMDGSAAPFIYLIQEAGVKRARRAAPLPEGAAADLADARRQAHRALSVGSFKVTYSIAFDHPLLRHQSRTIRMTEESFVDEIAPARTFTFLKEVEMLRQQGLALGGSLENAIVIGDTGVLNNALRFDDEFVRHKILDVIGDMALRRAPDHRPPRRAPRRARAAHRVCRAGARRARRVDAGRRRRSSRRSGDGAAGHARLAVDQQGGRSARASKLSAAPAFSDGLLSSFRMYASSLSFSYFTVLRNRLSSR